MALGAGWIYLGSVPAQNGDGQLNITDGSITTTANLQLGEATGGLGHINLDGGTINIGDLGLNGTDQEGTMNVTGGTMIIDGDETGGINYLNGEAVITAYGAWGTLNVDYNISNAGKTTITATAPGAVAATDVHWQDTGASHYWDRAKNWNAGGFFAAPRDIDDVFITQLAVGANAPVIRVGSVVDANQVTIYDDSLADTATLTVDGGTLTCNGQLSIGLVGSTGLGHLQLNAGTVTAVDLTGDPAYATIDIEEGVLILDGDETATIEALVTLGTLTAYNGNGSVAYDYDDANPGQTTVRACITSPVGDLNSDCIVNLKDFALISDNWLVDTSLPQ